jgi:uncharacterized repeat protein (TIGR03803 family)
MNVTNKAFSNRMGPFGFPVQVILAIVICFVAQGSAWSQSAPTITNGPATALATVNVSYSYLYTTTGAPTPTFTLASGTLPPGIFLATSGQLTGEPTQPGTFTGTISASNGVSPAATQSFTITVVGYSVLHSFSGSDGNDPTSPLIQATDGNFYGTTAIGGSGNYGAAFKISSQGFYSYLASFIVGTQGGNPNGLLQVSSGIFLGTTYQGTAQDYGTIYEMNPLGSFAVLHNFKDGSVPNDGGGSKAGMILGSDGNAYGTTNQGGINNDGTVFKVTPQGAVTILHKFRDGSVYEDGANPSAALLLGSDGNYYGTTGSGGAANQGTVFKMTPAGSVTILHSFEDGTGPYDGTEPVAPLIQGTDGNFYGTTAYGGHNYGTAFRMTPQGVLTILHFFGYSSSFPYDGNYPYGALVQAADGNFYGTTQQGGVSNKGMIFQMTPQGGYTILHLFSDGTIANDGSQCWAALVQGTDGNLYGTTGQGGASNEGTVFKLMPPSSAPIFTSASSATFYAGISGTFKVTAIGLPFPTFSATGLPSWATLNSTTGVLSVTPPITASGPFVITLTASNGISPNATQNFTINVVTPTPPTITNGPPTSVTTVNTPYSFSYQTTGAPTPTFSLTSGSLPPGLGLSSSGSITGSATTGGVYTGIITASNGTAPNATQSFTITVQQTSLITNGPPPTTVLLNATYSFTYLTSGYPAPSFTLSAGSLPPGIGLSTTGVLSGSPTQTGTYTGTVTASNGIGSASTQNFTIAVQESATITNNPPPPTFLVNTLFNFTYQATGYPAPTFGLSTGNLPNGLTLSSAGVLSGTPTQTGVFTGTVYSGNGIGADSFQNFTITIQQQPAFESPVPPARITVNTNIGFANETGFNCNALGYPTPTIALTSGSLPPGLTFSSNVISGAPTQIGTYTGALTASNGVSPAAIQNFSITVLPNPIQQYTVLHSFGSTLPDALIPEAGMIQAANGNFYGTSSSGYTSIATTTAGSIFTMTPAGTVTLLHTFSSDGSKPLAPLLQASDGNFYGTTNSGGKANQGTVFQMTPAGTVTVLHNFGDGTVANDGANPTAGLIQASDGSLYGTTVKGGITNNNFAGGVVFRVTTSGQYSVLHRFLDGTNPYDGAAPYASLVQGADGNFYGTTQAGGSTAVYPSLGNGTVYQITPQGVVTILHNFGDGTVPNDGNYAYAPLIIGTDGNFYGTTTSTIFRMTLQGALTTLYTFNDGTVANYGWSCMAPLVQGSDGNFYGVTPFGGGGVDSADPDFGAGTVFKMTPQGAITILHSFNDGSVANDGVNNPNSYAGLVQGSNGTLYGTTPSNAGVPANAITGTIFSFSLNEPTITSSPSSQNTVALGGTTNLSITATGAGPLTYQWWLNGTAIPGATNSTYTLTNASNANAGSYSVIVTDVYGNSVNSLPFNVTVDPGNTDTPTLPPWGLAILGLLLTAIAARALPKPSRA